MPAATDTVHAVQSLSQQPLTPATQQRRQTTTTTTTAKNTPSSSLAKVPRTPLTSQKTPSAGPPGAATAARKEYTRRSRERAYALIQKHAPGYIAEAQNSDWVMRLVMSIDSSYWKKLEAESQRANGLRSELNAIRAESAEPLKFALVEIDELKKRTQIAEEKCAGYEAAYIQAQDEIAGLRQGLELAEATAAAATAECASLQTLADKWSRSRERARVTIARRASDLRDRLNDTRSRLRNSQSLARNQNFALRKAEKEKTELAGAKERSDGRAADVQRLYERESTLLRSQVGLMQERLETALAPKRKEGAPPWRNRKPKVDAAPPTYAAWVPAGAAPPQIPPPAMSPRRVAREEECAVYAGDLHTAAPIDVFPHTTQKAWPTSQPGSSPARRGQRRTAGGVLDEVIRDRDLESAVMRADALAEAARKKSAEVASMRRRH